MSKKVNPIDVIVANHEWKKNKNKKRENPIVQKHYTFYLCQFKESIEAGYSYYLLARNQKGRVLAELESPRFRTKAEVLSFVDNAQLKGFIPV